MRIDEIKKEVHLFKPLFEKYEDTYVRNNTNCYSHALGITLPYLELLRVGAICGKKDIGQKYFSVEEIKELLFLDCKTLQLEIEESSLEEELLENQHKIALCVKKDEYGLIVVDYHFYRYDENGWTEKWRGRRLNKIQDFQRDKKDYFPWSFVGIFKISK